MATSVIENAPKLFQGTRFDVVGVDVPGHGGGSYRKDVVVHPGAVVVLPLLDDGRVALIRNERLAVGETLLELPAGTLEPPEPPEVCAGRELIEEAGYKASRIVPLTMFYTSPGICTEKMYAFLAEGLTHVGQALEETERITVALTPLDEALAMVRDGRIRDGKSIATLLFYQAFMRGTR